MAANRAGGELPALLRARVSLALASAAAIGFLVALALGSDAAARRESATQRAIAFYEQRPYLDAPVELIFAVAQRQGEGAELTGGEAEALAASFNQDEAAIAREQAELDALVAEAEAAERDAPAHRLGLARGAATLASAFVHPLLHASWLHLLWNLALLATLGARLELRVGRARYAGLVLGSTALGALVHLAASGSDAAPLVGLSAATASAAGALAVRPGGAGRDPLAPPGTRTPRSGLRLLVILAALACLGLAALGAGSLSFSPFALLAGAGLGAAAMVVFARRGWVQDGGAGAVSPEVAQAIAAIHSGNGAAALPPLRGRLAAADDPLAARALGLALRGRGDAIETLGEVLVASVGARHREAAIAGWRELAALGTAPRGASAALRAVASWLRSAGKLGEARVAALAALEGSDLESLVKVAKEARRGDPVLALRAAQRALADPALGDRDRQPLRELAEQARKDARSAGIVVLDPQREAEAAAARGAQPVAPPAAVRPTRSPLAAAPALAEHDAGALDLAGPGLAPEREPRAPAASSGRDTSDEAQRAFFDRDAIDLSAEPSAPPELPDPETAGDAALLDALHDALNAGEISLEDEPAPGESAGLEVTAEESDFAPAEPAYSLDSPRESAAPPAALERTVVGFDAAPPAAEAVPVRASAPRADDFAFGDADDELFEADPEPPPLRTLRVSEAKPERLGREAIVLEIAGRGQAKLGYGKIDAVAAAGVKGLSASGKAVLVIDLAIGYEAGEGELRVVRMRADGFDPRALVPGHTSPLAALRALVSDLRRLTRAAALPREVESNAPFRIYADLATYERETFGAERKPK
jgi:membrane associated rhomboid family serine protease